MMSTVDPADETPDGEVGSDAGLLGRLPRERPQNATRRRTAAREAAKRNGSAPSASERRRAASQALDAPQPTPAKRKTTARKAKASATTAKPKTAKVTAKAAPKAKAKARTAPRRATRTRTTDERPPVPPQGYESDGDRAQGIVRPPGGADLAATALEAVGELTRFSLSAGERFVRDLLGRRS
jgi:hypothetical protein